MARLFASILTACVLAPILAGAHQAMARQQEIASFMLQTEAAAPTLFSCRRYEDCDHD